MNYWFLGNEESIDFWWRYWRHRRDYCRSFYAALLWRRLWFVSAWIDDKKQFSLSSSDRISSWESWSCLREHLKWYLSTFDWLWWLFCCLEDQNKEHLNIVHNKQPDDHVRCRRWRKPCRRQSQHFGEQYSPRHHAPWSRRSSGASAKKEIKSIVWGNNKITTKRYKPSKSSCVANLTLFALSSWWAPSWRLHNSLEKQKKRKSLKKDNAGTHMHSHTDTAETINENNANKPCNFEFPPPDATSFSGEIKFPAKIECQVCTDSRHFCELKTIFSLKSKSNSK